MSRPRELPQLTTDQAVVLTIITGSVLIPMGKVLQDISERLERDVSPLELSDPEFVGELQDLYRPDFLKLVVTQPSIIVAR